MNDIRMFVWLLPLLFILHDMEEVIFAASWKKKESSLKKYALKNFLPFGTISSAEGCAIGVSEELLILTVVSFFSVERKIWNLVWIYGCEYTAFVAYSYHWRDNGIPRICSGSCYGNSYADSMYLCRSDG